MSWNLQGTCARWQSNAGAIELDLAAPELGARVDGREDGHGVQEVWGAVHGQVIGAPAEIAEAYVRGRDLIIDYAENPETQLTTTLMWRVLDAAQVCRTASSAWLFVELVVATRTSTLGTQPSATIHSIWPIHGQTQRFDISAPRDTLWSGQHPLTLLPDADQAGLCAIAWRSSHGARESTRLSWIHPSDGSIECELHSSTPTVALRHPMSLPLLEKGVIRSARVRYFRAPLHLTDVQLRLIADACFDAQLPINT